MAHVVFIASSANSLAWAHELQEALANRLRDRVQFKVWDQDIFEPSSTAIHDLLRAAKRSSAGIFVFSPDDNIVINGQSKTITRDNVIFEYGLFVGHLGLERTILVTPESLESYRLLSDVTGLTTIKFSFQSHDGDDRQSALGPTVNQITKKLHTALFREAPLNLSTLKSVGVSSATLETDDSTFSYKEAINASETQFALLGVGADKVTAHAPEFEHMVRRVMDRGGLIRLLLLDPDSYVTLQGSDSADVAQISASVRKSLQRVATIIAKLKCASNVRIRSYFAINHDHLPPFRVTLIDDSQCIVSPRNLDDNDQARLQPQLIFRSSPTAGGAAYYGAFRRYFEALWRKGNPETAQSMLQRIDALSTRTSLIGCVHGRFQPPHKGHLNYIRAAKARCEMLYIGITQPDIGNLSYCQADSHRSDPENNPLTFEERAHCLRRMLAEYKMFERRQYVIVPYDIDEPQMLRRYIPRSWVQYTTLIDPWNVQKNCTLEQEGYVTQSLTDRREDEQITGTNIRRLILQGDDAYRAMVTLAVAQYLEQINLRGRLKSAEAERLRTSRSGV